MEKTSLNIIGGGVSGVFLGQLLSDKNISVNIFEADDRPLKKLLATGNGRCNFTNLSMGVENYSGPDRELVKIALEEFSNRDLISYFEKHGMPSRVLESGRVYPATMAAKTVEAVLLNFLGENVRIHTGKRIVKLRPVNKAFIIEDQDGKTYKSDYLLLAPGGIRSIRGEFMENQGLLKSLSYSFTRTRPGIVQLKLKGDFRKIKNIKFTGRLDIYKEGKLYRQEEGDLLFTDYGLSGLASLQVSNDLIYLFEEDGFVDLRLDFLPFIKYEEIIEGLSILRDKRPNMDLNKALEGFLQIELLDFILRDLFIFPNLYLRKLKDDEIEKIARKIKNFSLDFLGPKSEKDGQITMGGLGLENLNMATMESKKHRGLYFAGEYLDVQGESGGYNLQWAFSSAYLVYKDLLNKLKL